MMTVDTETCSICQCEDASITRDEEGHILRCPECHAIISGTYDPDEGSDEIIGLGFPKASIKKLASWFPDVEDGVLTVDEVLDACQGHKVKAGNPIFDRTTKFKELGQDSFLVQEE